MTLKDLEQIHQGMDSHTKELRLTQGEERVLTTHARVMLRGKRSRPLPVILTPEVQEAVHSLVDFRQAGMVASSNPFVFALNSKVIIVHGIQLEPFLSHFVLLGGGGGVNNIQIDK